MLMYKAFKFGTISRMKKYSFLFCILLFITSCKSYTHLASFEEKKIDLGSTFMEDTETAEMVAPYKIQLEEEMNQVIGYCEKTLIKQKPESTLGNWLADLLLYQTRKEMEISPDLAYQNYGGIRTGNIPKGNVTKGKIFELMPFDNMLVVVAMNGEILERFIQKMASEGGAPASSTLQFAIEKNEAVDILLHGKKIDYQKIYYVAMPDYIANGGGRNEYLRDLERYNTGILLRDVIIRHVEELTAKGESIYAELDGRITLKERNVD